MGLFSFDKYKVEFYKLDKRLVMFSANKPKKFLKLVQLGIDTQPCDSVVIYKHEDMLKKGYVIQFNGSPEEAIAFAKNIK